MEEYTMDQPSNKDFWLKQLAVDVEKLRDNLGLMVSLKAAAIVLVFVIVNLIIYLGFRSRIKFPMTLYHIYYHGLSDNDREIVRRDSRWRDDLNEKCRKLENKIAKLEASFQPLSDRLHFIVRKMEARERRLCSLGDHVESSQYKE